MVTSQPLQSPEAVGVCTASAAGQLLRRHQTPEREKVAGKA